MSHEGEVLLTVETPTHVAGLGTALKTLLALIHDVYSQARAHGWVVDGIGLGVPGPVDVDKGMMSASASTLRNHVPEFYDVPIAEQIQALTELPTYIDNDVNALALGERAFGLGRGAASLAVLAIGTEIGGAFVAGGVIVRGAHGFAGELGHIPVNFDGPSRGQAATSAPSPRPWSSPPPPPETRSPPRSSTRRARHWRRHWR